eukprot:TRINITY_DN35196_c0_g2_i1.p1 TRINITY_DN35196_c0_g2~~TRINITY_DN35196_c0_g2_i1.p1  ORF type:complete len:560 (-),score=32.67 TRINITY_DN35196_c0_g2_i1:305-1984(-)
MAHVAWWKLVISHITVAILFLLLGDLRCARPLLGNLLEGRAVDESLGDGNSPDARSSVVQQKTVEPLPAESTSSTLANNSLQGATGSQAHDAASGTPPTIRTTTPPGTTGGQAALPSSILDLWSSTSMKPRLDELGSAVHITALVLAGRPDSKRPLPIPALSKGQGYVTTYVTTDDYSTAAAFRAGYASLMFPQHSLLELPFTDFAFDIVVIVNEAFCDNGASFCSALNGIVIEAVRLLSPAGILILTQVMGVELSVISPTAEKLLESTSAANVFHRRLHTSPDLPVCSICGLPTPFEDADAAHPVVDGGPWGDSDITRGMKGKCQAHLQVDYISSTRRPIVDQVLHSQSVAEGRFVHWNRANVLNTQVNITQWSDRYAKKTNNYARYVAPKAEKSEWVFDNLITSGRAKRVLDAGAGTCTLYHMLRQRGLLTKLELFMAFGAYDCSMLRICAESGGTSFQANWLVPLPICKSCSFDFIFAIGGIHHTHGWKQLRAVYQNFMDHLSCGGSMFFRDGGGVDPVIKWYDGLRKIAEQDKKKVQVQSFAGNSWSVHIFQAPC